MEALEFSVQSKLAQLREMNSNSAVKKQALMKKTIFSSRTNLMNHTSS